jgi:hypothetical protein
MKENDTEKPKRYVLFEGIKPMEIFTTPNRKFLFSVVVDTKYGSKVLDIKEFIRYTNPKTGLPNPDIFYPVRGGGTIKIQIDESGSIDAFFKGIFEFYEGLKENKNYKRLLLGMPTFQKAIYRRHAEAENREKANEKRREKRAKFTMFE